MSRVLALLLAAILGMSSTSIAQPARCERCDQQLSLTSEQWACLVRRLDRLAAQRSPVVFFTLSEAACNGQPAPRRSASTRVPEEVQTAAPRVFRVTRDNLACLSERSSSIAPRAGKVDLNFGTLCRGGDD